MIDLLITEIPQIYDPSSLLGNFYLDEFDKWVIRNGYIYFRYVDDMRFFCETQTEAKLILSKINITQYLHY